jgi:hypothetical protein
VYLGHAPLELGSEVASREMDVLEGGGQTAMPGVYFGEDECPFRLKPNTDFG